MSTNFCPSIKKMYFITQYMPIYSFTNVKSILTNNVMRPTDLQIHQFLTTFLLLKHEKNTRTYRYEKPDYKPIYSFPHVLAYSDEKYHASCLCSAAPRLQDLPIRALYLRNRDLQVRKMNETRFGIIISYKILLLYA